MNFDNFNGFCIVITLAFISYSILLPKSIWANYLGSIDFARAIEYSKHFNSPPPPSSPKAVSYR